MPGTSRCSPTFLFSSLINPAPAIGEFEQMPQPCVRIVRLALAVMFGITSPVVASVVSAAAPAERQPNIVIILADDFGYGSTNATGAPDSLVKTPNLNRLAQEGSDYECVYGLQRLLADALRTANRALFISHVFTTRCAQYFCSLAHRYRSVEHCLSGQETRL